MRPFILAMFTMVALAGHAQAHEYYAEGFTFVHPWAEAMAYGGATEAPVYFKLDNVTRNDRLLSATTRMAERVELRGSDDASAPALEAIEIAEGEQLQFYPGHAHLLLRGMVTPFQWGRSYDLRVVFEKAGPIDVQISIGAH